MDIIKTSGVFASLVANIFILWLVLTQEVPVQDFYVLLILEAFLVMVFGIIKILLLSSEEVKSPGYDFKPKKLSNILFIIAPINIALLANIFIFAVGGIFFLLYLLMITGKSAFTLITNPFFMNSALFSFFIVEIVVLIGFLITKNRSSTVVVNSTNQYTLPIALIILVAFGVYNFGLTRFFDAKIFVILVLLAKSILDVAHYFFGTMQSQNIEKNN